MGAGFRVGTILGIPIRIDYSWLIIFAILVFALTANFAHMLPGLAFPVAVVLGLVTALLFFGSVLSHELMHSVVARAKGLPVAGITLFIFGGVSQLEEEPASPRIEFEMAMVGPLTSLALAVLFFLAWMAASPARPHTLADYFRIVPAAGIQSWAGAVFHYLAVINLFLAIFNLAPGLPLDGGRLLRAVIWHFSRDLRAATRVATGTGQLLGYLLIGLGILTFLAGNAGGIWYAFIGWFLLQAAQQAYQQMLFRSALAGVSVGALARRDALAVPPDLSIQNLVDDYLLRYAANVFPVVEGDRVVGTVGMSEIHHAPRDEWPITPVSRIMRPVTADEVVSEKLDAWDAVQRLGHSECECLLLIDDGKLDGIVTRDSLLRWLHTQRQLRT